MTELIASLAGIGPMIAAFVAGLAGLVVFGFTQRRKGAKKNQAKQEKVDNETADDIRDRVDAIKPMRDDELDYRD